jgi:hypothetical protein
LNSGGGAESFGVAVAGGCAAMAAVAGLDSEGAE